ncbi:MAG: IPTL-CTERM sorting domain-containing protein [Cocleimonas sp.]
MKNKFKTYGLFGATLISTLLSTSAYAATLNIVTSYGDSGGNAGNLNVQGNQVNGNDICPNDNTYANGTPGCDMSADVAYSDNGTGDPSDDSYAGDLIVRTNDIFNVKVGYSWLGNAGGAEEELTLTGTLPAGKGFIFEGIPGSCDQTESSLSADRKTISCVRKNFDTNDTGSFAEDMAFPVRVEGDAANGSIPGDITFSVNDPTNSGPVSDGVEDGLAANLLKVTASPRWNIDKHSGAGYYTTTYGAEDENGNKGWVLWYQFSIEVDEVDGETDSAPGKLGNEALNGGTDATVSFIDDLANISPNAKLVTWDANGQFTPATNPCDMDYNTNSDEPYSYFNATYPDRSIKVPLNTMSVSCTPDAGDPTKINVTVDHIDGTLTDAPIKSVNGGLLPVNRAIAAIGVMRVFVPISDVELGEDGLANTADDGQLVTTNCLTDFNPVGISGGANFGNGSESTVDNCRDLTLYANRGSFDKSYRKGWSDQAVEILKWGGGGWSLPPTDASIVNAGDGTVTPGGVFGTYSVYNNTGGSAISNPVVCDVIDTETYEMTVIDPLADNAGTMLDDTIHAVDLNYSSTENVPGLSIEYGTGYVGNWPPDPNETPATGVDEVVAECNDPGVWYPDYVTAQNSNTGPVSKVRISAPSLPPAHLMAMRIKHTARSTYLSTKNGHTAGDPIPNNELLINHSSYKSGLSGDVYKSGSYIPHDADNAPENRAGDRLIMVRAKARILKALEPAAVSPGSDVTVTLTPSFTTDGPQPEVDNVTIVDLMPRGLTYTNGTTVGTYGDSATPYGEPQIISPVTDLDCTTHAQDLMDNGQSCGTFGGDNGDVIGGQSLLIWNLSNQITGTTYGDIVFHSIVDVDAPTGVLANYVLIDSPSDSSAPSQRISNANTNDSVPSSLLPVKSVITPLHEVNNGSVLNWMKFQLGLRNGSANTLTNLDVIDILPFNGDGVDGSFTYTPQDGTTVPRKREPATDFQGTFEFDDVTFDKNTNNLGDDQCTGEPKFWFTNVDPLLTTLDVSPLHASNDINGANTAEWCGGDATAAASLASCGFAKSAVTAVRVTGTDMIPSATCFINLIYATNGNKEDDVYSNTFGAKAVGVTNGVLSNTVSARVFASSIGDEIWHDKNNDGVLDAGEALDNVTVRLTPPAGIDLGNGAGVAITTTTDTDGKYLFDNLPAGDYKVDVVENTLPVHLQGNNTVDPDGGDDSTSDVTLGEDEDNTVQDFAYYVPIGSIGDKVWNDKNNDGVFDAGEGLGGVTVMLVAPGIDLGAGVGNPITVDTGSNGDYLFPNLVAGTYTVTVDENDLPASLQGKNTVDPDGGNNSTSSVNLGAAEDNLAQDFAYFTPGSIGDTVWHDKNNDGVLDAGEALAGVTVELTLPDGSKVTKVTDTDGKYLFSNLPAGDYAVEVKDNTLPAALQGKNTQDPDGTKDGKSSLTLGEGESNLDQDFAYFAPSSIGDTIWNDKDGDGVYDDGEGLVGVTVELTLPNGTKITKVTDADGKYLFENLQAGDYAVEVKEDTLPEGLQGNNTVDPDGGNDSKSTLTLGDGESNLDQDFAYFAPSSIGDTIWHDINNDGVVGEGEGLAGVTVTLTLPDGSTQTTTTDENGSYLFVDLPEGDFIVTVDESTLPEILQGNNSQDPDGANDSTSTVTLDGTGSNLDQDFAYVALGSIGDTVWNDVNHDGQFNEGDIPLSGLTVTLTPPANNDLGNGLGEPIVTTTDGNGNYLFSNLPTGDYTVSVDAPAGLANTVDPDGGFNSTSALSLAEGENNLDQDFAYSDVGHISGQVLHDSTGDGNGDQPIAGVTLNLIDADGNQIGTTVTDADGNYSFDNLVPGDYQIEQVQPAGYNSVSDTGNGDPENIISAITVNGGGSTAAANDFVEENAVSEPIPTLSEWALLLLMMMLGFVGYRQGLTRKD